jgi:hypothetical protein
VLKGLLLHGQFFYVDGYECNKVSSFFFQKHVANFASQGTTIFHGFKYTWLLY